MARKRLVLGSVVATCKRTGRYYQPAIVLILLDLIFDLVVALLYLYSQRVQGILLMFFWFLPGWSLLRLLNEHSGKSSVWMNLFGMGIVREAFELNCHTRGLFWARAIHECSWHVVPSATIQIWAINSDVKYTYDNESESDISLLMNTMFHYIVPLTSIVLSVFLIGYSLAEGTRVSWLNPEMPLRMWQAVMSLFALDFVTRVGAFCLTFNYNV